MKTTTLADLRLILRSEKADKIAEMMPITIYNEGLPRWVINEVDEVISLTDMHPRMKINLRALELKARAGMPQPERLDVKEFKNADSSIIQ